MVCKYTSNHGLEENHGWYEFLFTNLEFYTNMLIESPRITPGQLTKTFKMSNQSNAPLKTEQYNKLKAINHG